MMRMLDSKKGGFNKFLVIGILLVSLFAYVFSGIMFAVATKYSSPVDTRFQNMFNQYNAINAQWNTSNNIINNGNVNQAGFIIGVFPSLISFGKQLMLAAGLMGNYINSIPYIIPISIGIITMLILTISVLAVFGFVRLIAQRTP